MDDLSLISDYSIASLNARHAYLYEDAQGEMECLNKKGKDIYDFNWISFTDLEKNCSLDGFPYSATRALMSRRYQYFEKKPNGELICRNSSRYIGNTIMANMAEFEYARVMTHCGTIGFGKVINTPCGKWKYCDRCADIKRKFFYLRYGDVYGLTIDPCFFITITVDVEDKVVFTEQNQLKVIDTWNKMNLYVDMMYKKKLIKGAIIVEEAAFDSYYPKPVINPHLHILCVGTDALHTHRFDGMKIHVKTINNHEHWINELNYIHKTINFFSPYARDWTKDNAKVVNRNFRDMLNLHKHVVKNRNQSRAIGSFHGKSANSLVKTTKEMKEALRETRAASKEKPKKIARQKGNKKIQYINMFEQFASGARNQLKQCKEKLAVLEADPNLTVKKKEDTPWWKNPYILGGGALALGAGTYAAGKYYNGGDNIINNTLGKGVDNYVVNPIKNFFSKPEQKALPAPAPKPTTSVQETEASKPTPAQEQSLRDFLTGGTKKPVMQSVLGPSPAPKTFYDEAGAFSSKLPTSDELRPLSGVSPLRPELQKALGQNITPFEKYYDGTSGNARTILDARLKDQGILTTIADRAAERKNQNFSDSLFGKHFDSSQVLRNLQTRSQQAWNGNFRELEALPEFNGKTHAEIEKIMTGWQAQRAAFDRIKLDDIAALNPANINSSPLLNFTDRLRQNEGRLAGLTNAVGSVPTDKFQKAVDSVSYPAFTYDMANMANMVPAVNRGLVAAGSKLLGPEIAGTVGRANPALFPISAAIMNAPAGYRLGQDIANDPTSSYHKLMSSIGISPENMRYAGSAGTAGLAGGGTLLASQATRSALKGLLTRSLAAGATAGGSTIELSPVVAIPAALTTTLAAPVADTLTQRAVAQGISHVQNGDQLTNLYNNLISAKNYATANNDGSALRGLLSSEAFKDQDMSSPEGIKRVYDALGERGGNLLLAAKNKGLKEMLSSNLADLFKFNKYRPVEPKQFTVPNIPTGY